MLDLLSVKNYIDYMPKKCPKSKTLVRISPYIFAQMDDIVISLNYSLVGARALGALGRRFESCRPDSNNPSHRQVPSLSFLLDDFLIMRKGSSRGS